LLPAIHGLAVNCLHHPAQAIASREAVGRFLAFPRDRSEDMMTNKKHITLIVGVIGVGALLSSLLAGCCPYENRHVNGAVLPIPASGNAQASNLLITNWDPREETETVYVTYVAKDGNARKVLWEKEIAEYDGWYRPRAIFDERRIYYLAGERLLAFDQTDGSIAWEASLSDLVSTSCEHCIQKANDRIVILTTDYVLQGIDASSGELAWSVRLNNSSTAREGFSVVGGQIVLSDQTESQGSTQAVHIFDPHSGSLVRTVSPTCPETDYRPWFTEMFIDRSSSNGRVIFLYKCISDPFVQSWDLASGEMVWQQPLPEDTDTSVDSFLLGHDTLYVNVYHGRLKISLATGQTENLPEPDPDYEFILLEEHEDILIGKARRTRGSTRHELWGLKGVAERIWSYELGTDTLFGVDSGSADWTYRLTPDGIVVIQILDDPEPHISVVLLNPQNGQVIQQNEMSLKSASLQGVAWDSDTAYMTLWGDVYAVDLATLAITPEWP
jgi:outer membrane protein assembly factor BamB